MTAVLVYNATYEPLSRTRLARAINLVLSGDAVIEEADPHRRIRHKNGEMPWPKIIRMLRYIKVPLRYGPQTWTKAGVLRRDNKSCGYCSKPATTVDHIHPKSRGGGDTWDNTVAACLKCNAKKRDRTPQEAGMTLLIVPKTPMRMHIAL